MPHEVSEHIEHAAHEATHQGNLARRIGLTIAVLGVLMALCSAHVGASRTELIATMVEENGAALKYQTVSTKYRMLEAQLQQLHALMPDPKVMTETEGELRRLEEGVKNPETAQGIQAVRLETKKILSTVTPTQEDVLRFAKLIRRHQREVEAAEVWAESYAPAIKSHSDSASRYEIAQVAAEIGVVIASVALLLSNLKWFARGAWFTAIALGLVSLAIAGGAKIANSGTLHQAEEKIAETQRHFTELSQDREGMVDDEKLLQDIEQKK